MFFHDYNNRKAGIYKMPDISVLIIDDEPSILKAVSMTLKQEHIAVTLRALRPKILCFHHTQV